MLKKLYAAKAILLLLLLPVGCGQLESINVYVKDVFANTMISINPDYEGDDAFITTKAEPEYEEFTLTKDSDVTFGVSVESIKEDEVIFKYDENCISARIFDDNGDGYLLREGEKGKIALNKGEELVLEEIALLDESHTVYIQLK